MSTMTEVYSELPESPDKPDALAPDELDTADQETETTLEVAGGVESTLQTDALVSPDGESAFGELVEEHKTESAMVATGPDEDLLGEDTDSDQTADEDAARTQVTAALERPSAEEADTGGSDGTDKPKPPTGGNGGSGSEEDDEGPQGDEDPSDPRDTEEDLHWAREHADELALLEQMLRAQQERVPPDTDARVADNEEAGDDIKDPVEAKDTDPPPDEVADSADEAEEDEPEEEVAPRPEWVETRTLEEIDALKDQRLYSNEDLAQLWRTGDPEAASALLTRNTGFFHMMTVRNLHTDEYQDYDDVRQQYEYLFLKALQNYDPDKGAKALSYAGTIAEQQLIDGREPARDAVGAQPIIRQIERRIFVLDRMLEQSGGHTPLTDAQIGRFKLNDDQLAALRQVEARVLANGYSPLTNDEVLAILHSPDASSSSSRYISAAKLDSVRQHTALTDNLLSADHVAPEFSVWLGNNVGIMSDNEITSHARPVMEVPQVSVEEQVESKLTSEALHEALPRALEVLPPNEREILYLRTVEGLSLDKAAERLAESQDAISRERVRQVHTGIVEANHTGSSRGALFRHMISEATGYPVEESFKGPKASEIMQARQAMTAVLPLLGEQSRSILNGYFVLDGRDTTSNETLYELADRNGITYADANRIVNQFVATVAGNSDVGNMRQAMLEFTPFRYPLTDDERAKWGLAS